MGVYGCESKEVEQPKSIVIQPFGGFPQKYIDTVQKALSEAFQTEILVVDAIDLPLSSFIKIKSPRYRADSLLRFLQNRTYPNNSIVLALNTKDISVTKRNLNGEILEPKSKYEDWGVFGVATLNWPYAVVSTYRLKSKNANFFARLKKICIHEIGHTKGLPHCPNTKCIMQDAAETIETIDKVSGAFCERCMKRIKAIP